MALIKRRDYQEDCRIYQDRTVTQFCDFYSRSGEFAVDLCIIALVDFLRVNISVHFQSISDRGYSHSVVTFSPTGGSTKRIEIICYVNGLHYECVLTGAALAIPTPPISLVTCRSLILG